MMQELKLFLSIKMRIVFIIKLYPVFSSKYSYRMKINIISVNDKHTTDIIQPIFEIVNKPLSSDFF